MIIMIQTMVMIATMRLRMAIVTRIVVAITMGASLLQDCHVIILLICLLQRRPGSSSTTPLWLAVTQALEQCAHT